MARRAVKPRRRMGERSGRPRRPKISPLTIATIDYVDYKDTELLNKFVSERAKLKPRLNSGNDAQQQRTVARAVKNAREMALLPYTSRLTTQRRERRGERGARAAGPPPRPTAPPPGSSGEHGESDDLPPEEQTMVLEESGALPNGQVETVEELEPVRAVEGTDDSNELSDGTAETSDSADGDALA